MKLNLIALVIAAAAFGVVSAQAQDVVVKEKVAPGVTVKQRYTTGTTVRHCVNKRVTEINAAGVRVTKTVRRCD